MKKRIPDLLLVIATATAALSASSSRRPWKDFGVSPREDHQEFLAFDLQLGPDLKAAKGRRLDADLTTQLDALGFHTVRVRNPATPVVTLPVKESAGEVLAAPVALPGQTQTLPKGRLVDDALKARASEAGVELEMAGEKLASPAELPKLMRASAFLDDEAISALQSAGVTEVPVKRVAPFEWRYWSGRWAFLLSIFAMAVAVGLKRALATETAESTGPGVGLDTLRALLAELSERAGELSGKAAAMSAAEIHGEVDALLQGPAYAFVEGRATLQKTAGMTSFALVMDPFSRGERQLSRAWSASVDDHAEEARTSLLKAAPLLEAARDAFPG